jgi:hypothetical protein
MLFVAYNIPIGRKSYALLTLDKLDQHYFGFGIILRLRNGCKQREIFQLQHFPPRKNFGNPSSLDYGIHVASVKINRA